MLQIVWKLFSWSILIILFEWQNFWKSEISIFHLNFPESVIARFETQLIQCLRLENYIARIAIKWPSAHAESFEIHLRSNSIDIMIFCSACTEKIKVLSSGAGVDWFWCRGGPILVQGYQQFENLDSFRKSPITIPREVATPKIG